MNDLERNQATYIVDTAPAGIYGWNHYPVRDYPLLAQYIQEKYRPLGQIDSIQIYKRRGCR